MIFLYVQGQSYLTFTYHTLKVNLFYFCKLLNNPEGIIQQMFSLCVHTEVWIKQSMDGVTFQFLLYIDDYVLFTPSLRLLVSLDSWMQAQLCSDICFGPGAQILWTFGHYWLKSGFPSLFSHFFSWGHVPKWPFEKAFYQSPYLALNFILHDFYYFYVIFPQMLICTHF